eukprot:TRINITY_DN1129_c0_g1_i1.p1 TRINITY_DN1129_c0_g1~~TRINITY_DN1129_c0_g1_i1.p1  ORF type:complete len:193 (+),score=45.00 TRINITY_DN1129_c0_g1_i1:38-616(+)
MVDTITSGLFITVYTAALVALVILLSGIIVQKRRSAHSNLLQDMISDNSVSDFMMAIPPKLTQTINDSVEKSVNFQQSNYPNLSFLKTYPPVGFEVRDELIINRLDVVHTCLNYLLQICNEFPDLRKRSNESINEFVGRLQNIYGGQNPTFDRFVDLTEKALYCEALFTSRDLTDFLSASQVIFNNVRSHRM